VVTPRLRSIADVAREDAVALDASRRDALAASPRPDGRVQF